MFYERFTQLCKENNISPSAAVEAIGLNKANASFWKRGSLPSSKNVQKLAEYFNVPVDYLLGTESDLASFPWLLDGPDADIPRWLQHDSSSMQKVLARAQMQLSEAEKGGFVPEIERWKTECAFLQEIIAQSARHTVPANRTKVLLSIFEQLNATGQDRALEWIAEISKIPDYQRKN